MFTEKGYFPLNFKFKDPEIWNIFLNFKRSILWNSLSIKLKNLNFYKNLSYC